MMVVRHLLAILLLPFMVTVVIPRWLLSGWSTVELGGDAPSPIDVVMRILGVLFLVAGLALFTWCVMLFARVGQGTLAPWDPTRRLVAVGPYRHVRNPMISAVATILAGEALLFGSRALALWLALFVVWNHLYFVFSEEPGLAKRFGLYRDGFRGSGPSRSSSDHLAAFGLSNRICGSTSSGFGEEIALGSGDGGRPAFAGVGAAMESSARAKNGRNISIGSGKIVVELFSAAISVTVCRYRN